MNRTFIASLIPFGIGHTKPHHFLDMVKVVWENRDNLPFAWRILTHGVCDGCSLGPRGLSDETLDGVHLCMSRLKMLRLNTMKGLDPAVLANVDSLRSMSGEQLRELGRLPYPMIRERGERGFRRIGWDEALKKVGEPLKAAEPDRSAFFTTSRGITNEIYYVAQKLARLKGTNNIDNAARLCHAASTVGLKQTIGVGASTCSYDDWLGADLIVLFGSDAANNQPVSVKYLYHAKKNGARIVVVNPYREPGLDKYWIPSITKSALFGTRLMDDFFQVQVGGDVAFLNGVLKYLIENRWLDESFIREHTVGFADTKTHLESQKWEELEEQSGLSRNEMLRFAKLYAKSNNSVMIWSMGLTQHRFGVENVKAVVNLALARGNIGRENCGLVPIRGHSGVQGGAECGAVPNTFPGGYPVNEENAARFRDLWGTDVPDTPGLHASAMIDAAHSGDLDFFYIVGGNFLETLPDPRYAKAALSRVACRVHQDLIVNSSMLVDPLERVVLLPGQTRYEQKGGGTATSTERRIRFSPEIQGPRIGETRSEWEILRDVGRHAFPESKAEKIDFPTAQSIRDEMEEVIPLYKGISSLIAEGDSVQYGGRILLRNGECSNLPDGKARFSALTPPDTGRAPDRTDQFYLATRRGRQFNSIVWGEQDPLTGARHRNEIFISPADARALEITEGGRIRLSSEMGEFDGIAKLADVKPKTLQAFWPEVNPLLPRRIDEASKEPDYNVFVSVSRID